MASSEHINLDAIADAPASFAFELPLSVAGLEREPLVAISPVRLEGTVSPIEGGFRMEARCAFESRLECSRCLAPYPSDVDETFTLLLYPRGSAGQAGGDQADVVEFDGREIAVAPIAEERVQLSIPMKPLCGRECQGLCPQCGADRNAGPCGCAESTADPRWSALESFKNAAKTQKA